MQLRESNVWLPTQKNLTEICSVCTDGLKSTLAADGIKLTLCSPRSVGIARHQWHSNPLGGIDRFPFAGRAWKTPPVTF